jgi:capsular polysaccharide biosynthesis protein
MTETVRPTDERDQVQRRERVTPADPVSPARAEDQEERRRDGTGRSRRPARPGVLALLALVVIAAFAGGAIGFSLRQPTVYGAEAEFLLTPRPELSDTAVDRAMVTQVMIVESPTVLQPVATRTGESLTRLGDKVEVEIVGRSNILRITVADRDQARALTQVQLVAAGYAAAAGDPATAPIRATVLTPARALDQPLQPQPMRALAAGTLLGVLAAGLLVLAVWRPWRLVRPSYWT